MTDQVQNFGQAGRALPGPTVDGGLANQRLGRYGESLNINLGYGRHALADEGTYFVAHNITNDASTTLAGHAAPVLADADATMTKPFIFCRFPAATSSQVRCYLDYIEIEVVTAGGSGTAANWAAQLDTGATRYSSGTVETLTTVNPNMQSNTAPTLVTLAGPVVVGAESASVRHLGHGQLRPSIEIAGDKKVFVFGRDPVVVAAAAAAAVREQVVNMPPVVLGPNDQFLLALYAPSQAAAGVYKVRMGWWER